ncbi:Lrp/AsnC family transcriptional regulator [Amphibiibacter pelophylacis]|uniref:Lrp/AsnC family transcriptional regulator n=1 Tax=Amphibiibacter pelophylacis TaxID=1799477 RepID=A0ACC6P113_9BURK
MNDSSTAASIPLELDDTDRRLLRLLQEDASRSNAALARLAHVSPATALRRVRRLMEGGVIQRVVALLAPQQVAQGLHVVLEITLDPQTDESALAFEAAVQALPEVQQAWRTGGGIDFVLIAWVADMAHYQRLSQSLLSGQRQVRNVRAYFSIRRSKFDIAQPVDAAPRLP